MRRCFGNFKVRCAFGFLSPNKSLFAALEKKFKAHRSTHKRDSVLVGFYNSMYLCVCVCVCDTLRLTQMNMNAGMGDKGEREREETVESRGCSLCRVAER